MHTKLKILISIIVVIMFLATTMGASEGNISYGINPDESQVSCYYWSMNGSLNIIAGDNNLTLVADINSFSSNDGAASACFVVSNGSITDYHFLSIASPGTYKYTFKSDLTGAINFHITYMDKEVICRDNIRMDKPEINPDIINPTTHTSRYYSSFGNACICILSLSLLNIRAMPMIGYDGNDTIYLSNTPETEPIYGYINLTGTESPGT